LNTNYRSTEKIIKESNNFIKQHASDFVPNFLECMKEPGAKVAKMLQVRSGDIVEEILLIKNREKLRFKDIAIIYRKNYLSTFFEEKLSIKKIPYEIINYDKFATRDEIKDVINFLKNIVDSENDFYIIESLKKFKGIKESVLLKLEEISRKNNISIFDLFLVYPEKFNIFSHQEKKMLNSFFEKLLILKGIAEGKGELQSFVKKIIKDFDYYFYLENKDIEGERINSVNNLIEIIGK
jgi:DNA helicase-2/ATP-dependent DNA helicase PcrA